MKYLAFITTALSLTILAILIVLGIQLDVLLGGVMKLYMFAMTTTFVLFVLCMVMLIRFARQDQDKSDSDKNAKIKKGGSYAPGTSFTTPSSNM
jgi:hypothetical protein